MKKKEEVNGYDFVPWAVRRLNAGNAQPERQKQKYKIKLTWAILGWLGEGEGWRLEDMNGVRVARGG